MISRIGLCGEREECNIGNKLSGERRTFLARHELHKYLKNLN